MDSTELKELLKGTPAFAILSDAERERFGEQFELVHYALGQTVVRAGEEADSFYLVYSGRARVVANDATGEEVTVGTLNRGDTFGEQGLLTTSRRNFTVRAVGDLALLRLRRNDFERLLVEHPDLREYFNAYISDLAILRQISIRSLRSQVGVVPQDVFLFSGTIRENIAFGDPDALLERVVGAAILAGAHEFISE